MEARYRYIPFLAIKEKRKDLLLENPSDPPKEVLDSARRHLIRILKSKVQPVPTDPANFFVEAILISFSPSEVLWKRFAKHYSDLALAFPTVLTNHYRVPRVMKVEELLSIERPYPEVKLYHLEVSDGNVYLGDRAAYVSASLLFNDIVGWIREKVRSLVESGALESLRDAANSVISPGRGKGKYGFIKKIISVNGLPDGRKRVLYYWLIPYWVTVEGRSPEEVIELANEWISRQGGSKIYTSWIHSEAENVKKKGIKPWSLKKVEKLDPELIKLLREVGVVG